MVIGETASRSVPENSTAVTAITATDANTGNATMIAPVALLQTNQKQFRVRLSSALQDLLQHQNF